MLRFDTADGKQFRPLTLWRDADGKLEWRWESWPSPRPLYGLKELAERPAATVVVCEGEKSADAARKLLPGFVVVSSPNGSKSAKQADWSPLRERDVVIWPDADASGEEYAHAVTECLAAVGARRWLSFHHLAVSKRGGMPQMRLTKGGCPTTQPD
jgi:hypothetical protein